MQSHQSESPHPPTYLPHLSKLFNSLIWACLDADLNQSAVFLRGAVFRARSRESRRATSVRDRHAPRQPAPFRAAPRDPPSRPAMQRLLGNQGQVLLQLGEAPTGAGSVGGHLEQPCRSLVAFVVFPKRESVPDFLAFFCFAQCHKNTDRRELFPRRRYYTAGLDSPH